MPNTWFILRIMETISVAVVPTEKWFSQLKLIQTYLNSLCKEKLSALVSLTVELNSAAKLNCPLLEIHNEKKDVGQNEFQLKLYLKIQHIAVILLYFLFHV